MILDKERKYIAKKVRELRVSRSWTQADLAEKIGISQSRLSELETNAGSFTAEQLLAILRIFNVSVTEFAPDLAPNREQDVQNALARLGGSQLVESERVLPSEELAQVHGALREALVLATPRLLTAIAPVLVTHHERIVLAPLLFELSILGLERRLGWAVDNTRIALDELAAENPTRWERIRKRVRFNYGLFKEAAALEQLGKPQRAPDVLDATIQSKTTLEAVRRRLSEPSREWGIVTALQPADFMEALEASDVGR